MSRSHRVSTALSFEQWMALAVDCSLPEAVFKYEAQKEGQSAVIVRERLKESLCVMKEAIATGLSSGALSPTGLSGGDALRLFRSPINLTGEIGKKAVAYALATAELNASMGRIVAAPTAGSSGVLPGVMLSLAETLQLGDDVLVEALVVAGGIGLIISARATLAGAEGGCQAECGAAAAMAAGAAVYLLGGDALAVAHAAAMTISNLLGLVCDPVAGLVEVPCISRNAGGAVMALLCAELALAGIRSIIPPDEVVDALCEVGDLMPASLRETAGAGLANTPTARRLEKKIFNR